MRLFTMMLLILCCARLNAQDGAPDLDFGGRESKHFVFGITYEKINDIAVQPDGKVLLAGSREGDDNEEDFFVMRLNADYSVDTSFGDAGIMTFDFFPGYSVAHDLLIQPDGKILVGGISTDNSGFSRFAVARLDQNGDFDDTFSNNGQVTILFPNVSGESQELRSMALLSDGSVLLGGNRLTSLNSLVVVKLNSTGEVDTSFGAEGVAEYSSEVSSYKGRKVVVTSTGRIVLVGYKTIGTRICAAAFHPDGTIDTNFGVDGLTEINTDLKAWGMDAVVIEDDMIVVGGYMAFGQIGDDQSSMLLIRLHENGAQDPTFGYQGECVIPNSGYSSYGQKMISSGTGADRKYFITGWSENEEGRTFFCTGRVDATGDPLNMGMFNVAQPEISAHNAKAFGIAFAGDGNVLVGGMTYSGESDDAAIAVYSETGAPQKINLFGISVRAMPLENNVYPTYGISSTMINPQGKILCTASALGGEEAFFQWLSNGMIDYSFGEEGLLHYSTGNNPDLPGLVSGYAAMLSNGKVIVVSKTFQVPNVFVVIKYHMNGNIDTSFGDNGMAQFELFESDGDIGPYSFPVIGSDNSIYVAGSFQVDGESTGYDAFVVKFNADGTPDVNFGINGMVRYDAVNTYFNEDVTGVSPDMVHDVALGTEGEVFLCGHCTNSTDGFIAKLLPGGELDTTFGNGGVFLYAQPELQLFLDFALSPVGDLFVLLNYEQVLKILPDGIMDNSFGVNGVLDLLGMHPEITDPQMMEMLCQPDGKILMSGRPGQNDAPNVNAVVLRLNPDGTMDNAFADNGLYSIDVFGYREEVATMVFGPNEDVIVSGRAYGATIEPEDQYMFHAKLLNSFSIGVEEFTSASQQMAVVYPNPVSTNAIFEFDLPSSGNVDIDLLDASGRIVRNCVSNKSFPAGKSSESIQFDQLDAGIYFLRVHFQNQSCMVKVFVK
jgi:uncharacterized delta-60 repeat protein